MVHDLPMWDKKWQLFISHNSDRHGKRWEKRPHNTSLNKKNTGLAFMMAISCWKRSMFFTWPWTSSLAFRRFWQIRNIKNGSEINKKTFKKKQRSATQLFEFIQFLIFSTSPNCSVSNDLSPIAPSTWSWQHALPQSPCAYKWLNSDSQKCGIQLFHVYPFGFVAPGTWYWSIGPFSKLLGLWSQKTTRQKKNPDFNNNESREAQTSMLYMSRIFLARKYNKTWTSNTSEDMKTWNLHQANRKKKWYSSKIWFAVMSSSVEYPWVVWNQLCTRQAVLRAVKSQKVTGALGWFNIPNQSFKIVIILSLSDIFELTGMRMPSLWHGHFYLNSLTFELLTALTGLLGLMQHATVGMSPLQLGFVPLYITFLLQTKKKSLSFNSFGIQAGSLIWYFLVRGLNLNWNETDVAMPPGRLSSETSQCWDLRCARGLQHRWKGDLPAGLQQRDISKCIRWDLQGCFCQVSKITNHDPRIPKTKAWVRNTLEKMFLQLEIPN